MTTEEILAFIDKKMQETRDIGYLGYVNQIYAITRIKLLTEIRNYITGETNGGQDTDTGHEGNSTEGNGGQGN